MTASMKQQDKQGIILVYTCTYGSPGTYTVAISGTFPRIYFANTGDRRKILTIEQWGTNAWTSMVDAFYGCSNLTSNAVDTPNLSTVTSTRFMFRSTLFNSDVSSWDVSSVTNMSGMFYGAASFNQDLSSWDVSSVTDMAYMFGGADSFNQDLSSWDVSSVTDMADMFGGADSFNQDLSSWDVSSVIDMTDMFSGADSFNQPLNSWDVSSVTNMYFMFNGATSFNQPLNSWDVSSVTEMSHMFNGATSFDQDLSSWDVSSVTSMYSMFSGADSFNQDLSSWDVSLVTNMTQMFGNSGLSTENYSNILIAWSGLTVQNNVPFGANGIYYLPDAQDERDILTGTYNWTITDEGVLPDLPEVTTNLATSVSYTSATLNAEVTNDTPIDEVGFEYGIGSFDESVESSLSDAPGEFDYELSGLTCDTEYQFRAYAINGVGTVYGDLINFETVDCGLIVTQTNSASNITNSSVKFHGEYESSNPIIERGFQYGVNSYSLTTSETGSFSSDDFSLPVSDLYCETEYQYRAFVTDSEGTSYGSTLTFTTGTCEEYYETSENLYAVDGSGDNGSTPNLYILDKDAGTIISTIGEVGDFYVTGLAYDAENQILYGSTGGAGTNKKSLLTIDTDTGAGTLLGRIQDGDENQLVMQDLAFDSSGTLYGFSNRSWEADYALYTIDPETCDGVTCLAVLVGVEDYGVGGWGNGLTFDLDGKLFLFAEGDDTFFQLDPDTGSVLDAIDFSNSSGGGYNIGAATTDSEGTIYAIRRNYGSSPSDLIVVDTDTGEITSRGDNEDLINVDAIAFSQVATLVPAGTPYPYTTPSRPITGVRINKTISPSNNNTPPTDCLPSYNFSPSTGKPCTHTNTTTDKFIFLNNLSKNMNHPDVKELQKYLNSHGFPVSSSGPGSIGNETTYFGTLTQNALIQFQKSKSITPSSGFFGPITRGVVNNGL